MKNSIYDPKNQKRNHSGTPLDSNGQLDCNSHEGAGSGLVHRPAQSNQDPSARQKSGGKLYQSGTLGRSSSQSQKAQAADAALILACDQSFQTAGETLLLSAAVGGFIVNQLPWGEITPWLETHCPSIYRSKITRWQTFSSALTAANPDLISLLNQLVDQARNQITYVGNSPPGGVSQLLFRLDSVDVKPLWETIQATTDGKSMTAFIRDTKLLREPQSPTHHPRKEIKLSADEQLQIAIGNANEDFAHAAQTLDSVNRNFFLLDDLSITAQVAVLETALQARRTWLKTAKAQRNPEIIIAILDKK